MAGELGVDKVHRGTTFRYETIAKMEKKFLKEGETFAQMLERVCAELTKDVKLTRDVHDRIDAQIAENYRKRFEKRNKISGK